MFVFNSVRACAERLTGLVRNALLHRPNVGHFQSLSHSSIVFSCLAFPVGFSFEANWTPWRETVHLLHKRPAGSLSCVRELERELEDHYFVKALFELCLFVPLSNGRILSSGQRESTVWEGKESHSNDHDARSWKKYCYEEKESLCDSFFFAEQRFLCQYHRNKSVYSLATLYQFPPFPTYLSRALSLIHSPQMQSSHCKTESVTITQPV